jgi:hypothetical protein
MLFKNSRFFACAGSLMEKFDKEFARVFIHLGVPTPRDFWHYYQYSFFFCFAWTSESSLNQASSFPL